MNHNRLVKPEGTIREPELMVASVFYRHDSPHPREIVPLRHKLIRYRRMNPPHSLPNTLPRKPDQAPNIIKAQIGVKIFFAVLTSAWKSLIGAPLHRNSRIRTKYPRPRKLLTAPFCIGAIGVSLSALDRAYTGDALVRKFRVDFELAVPGSVHYRVIEDVQQEYLVNPLRLFKDALRT